MNILNAIKRAFIGDSAEPIVLDHADIAMQDAALDWRDAKLQEAAAKYGKPWAHEVKVPRQTERSHVLQHIESKCTVTSIHRRGKERAK